MGLERSGLGRVVWQVEKDPFCRAVLAKHWPLVERFEDVAEKRRYPPVDLVCGGFPCQDVSAAGKGKGIAEGTRSGLWFEFRRIIEEVKPRWVVVENVASGKRRWLPQVRRDLHVLGYRTTAFALSASDVGAPHLRRRIFVVADAFGEQLREQQRGRGGQDREGPSFPIHDGEAGLLDDVAHPDSERELEPGGILGEERRWSGLRREELADPDIARLAVGKVKPQWDKLPATERGGCDDGGWWASEPEVGRLVDGVSGRLAGRNRRAALRALGNAVVPQCAEVIGRIIAASISS